MNNKNRNLLVVAKQPNASAKPDGSLPLSFRQTLFLGMKNAWQPTRLPKPEVDPRLTQLPALERCAEVVRYELSQLEYAISPGGELRGWLRLNCLLALFMGIPALFFVPIITYVLGSFATLTGFLFEAVTNLFYTLLTILAIGAVIWGVGVFIKQLRLRRIHR